MSRRCPSDFRIWLEHIDSVTWIISLTSSVSGVGHGHLWLGSSVAAPTCVWDMTHVSLSNSSNTEWLMRLMTHIEYSVTGIISSSTYTCVRHESCESEQSKSHRVTHMTHVLCARILCARHIHKTCVTSHHVTPRVGGIQVTEWMSHTFDSVTWIVSSSTHVLDMSHVSLRNPIHRVTHMTHVAPSHRVLCVTLWLGLTWLMSHAECETWVMWVGGIQVTEWLTWLMSHTEYPVTGIISSSSTITHSHVYQGAVIHGGKMKKEK